MTQTDYSTNAATDGENLDRADQFLAGLTEDQDVNGKLQEFHANGNRPGNNDWLAGVLSIFKKTDLGNAHRFKWLHECDARYCWPRKCWFIWNGIRWEVDQHSQIYNLAKEVVKHIYEEIVATGGDREALSKWAIRSQSNDRINAMLSLARSEPGIPVAPNEMDSDPWLLNVENGTLNLRTGELQPHRREDLITSLAPVIYNPSIEDSTWNEFIEHTLPNLADRVFVQMALGYSLTGDTSSECLFFPFGPTATGKSTLMRAVQSMLGDYAITADLSVFVRRDFNSGGARNDLATLAGRRFIVSVEVESGQYLAEGLVKQFTGRDKLSARFLYQESFEFVPTGKLWIAANDRPGARSNDDALWRRIHQIPFDNQIPESERDPGLKTYLCESARSAILNWCMAGLRAWQRDG